jgi:aldehyde:ferredoxin oxidoreductase
MDGDDRGACDRPRVLRVDLGRVPSAKSQRASAERWRGSTREIDQVGCWSGTALALALLHESEVTRPGAPAPLVVSVGECVRRALPTAARAGVTSRAPLTGLLGDGQVGSDLGRRLARIADALVLEGNTPLPGAVLWLSGVGGEGTVELLSFPDLADADPGRVHTALNEALGPCATLRVGRAGARGIPFASLAAGADPPSFVGRGGLGAVLGRLGLTAIAVGGSAVEPDPGDDFADLARRLALSPRLRARAEGGTLELADALAARGDLRGRGYAEPMPADEARAWSAEIGSRDHARKGCEGCPTPCGWVFERGFPGAEARRQGARFGAMYALGPNLGLESTGDALALLAACDEAALDAVEAGAVLSLLARARDLQLLPGRAPWGDPEALLALLGDLLERRGDGALLALGASGMARKLGLEGEVRDAQGQSARPESSLAAVLGQCASARGADPMRTFPFLLSDASGRRLRELLAPLPLPPGAEDPRDPTAKGRIVWWHENLMAALDATGFCAFSAAGLLTDGVAGLDDLARAIAPASLEPRSARALLAAGASIVTLARDLNRRWGARPGDDLPTWAREDLVRPGMWPEYARLRGLDASGHPSPRTWERLATEAILDVGGRLADVPARGLAVERATAGFPRSRGQVDLRCFGPLARQLGARESGQVVHLEIDLPASLGEVLAAAARLHPRARRYLVSADQPVPVAYRSSRRLHPDDPVEDGDELDLVVALSGGVPLS